MRAGSGGIVPRTSFSCTGATVNLQTQERFFTDFYSQCLDIIRSKGPDYAPDGIPLLDLLATCVEANVSPPQALWVFLRKHMSAVCKHFVLDQSLTSESITSRLHDTVNYCGFLAFWEVYQHDLIAAWRQHWAAQTCEYTYEDQTHPPMCQRCVPLRWLDMQVSNQHSVPISSGTIRKAQD